MLERTCREEPRNSCSQNRITRQPDRRSLLETILSRERLRATFADQYAELDAGAR